MRGARGRPPPAGSPCPSSALSQVLLQGPRRPRRPRGEEDAVRMLSPGAPPAGGVSSAHAQARSPACGGGGRGCPLRMPNRGSLARRLRAFCAALTV